jgi:hypothetical protein
MIRTRTMPRSSTVDEYLASRASPEQLKDCKSIMAMCKRITRQRPTMWGASIVAYGTYPYRTESGYRGQASLAAFAIRGKDLVVYLVPDAVAQARLLAKLGTHRVGKSCLYVRRLADLDVGILEALIASSAAEAPRRFPPAATEPGKGARRAG